MGSSSDGQGAGVAQTLQVDAGKGRSIAYVALYFNIHQASTASQLVFNDLTYTGS